MTFTKNLEGHRSRVPLVYVVIVTVTLVYLGHFGQSRLTEYLPSFQTILTLVAALALVSQRATPPSTS